MKLQIENDVKDAVHLCRDILDLDFVINNKVDYSVRRRIHRGGLYKSGPGINLAGPHLLYIYNNYTEVSKYIEYPSFALDPVIGNKYIYTPKQYTYLLVGHEVSHAVQRYTEFKDKRERSSPHGDYFKSIYAKIRVELNKTLPNQIEASKKYNELLNLAKKRETK